MTKMSMLTCRIVLWLSTRFGIDCLTNRKERALRVAEEAIELAQAEGIDEGLIYKVAHRVYSRPPGEPRQEAAGVNVCLLAWAYAAECDLDAVTEREMDRVEAIPADVLRARHNAKAEAGTSFITAPTEPR